MVDDIRALVRPVTVYVFVAAVVVGFGAQRLSADQFLPLATLAIGFYFGDRSARKSG
jgi:hypothetical protein